jgi:predicted  nucleic acid-binding Zn-ribbon protein
VGSSANCLVDPIPTMLPDLERLIRLQELDAETEHRRKWTADLPTLLASLDQRVVDRQTTLDTAKQRQADNLAARRALEKDLAVVQGRLTRFRDQLMEVKTNKEYLAMQHEIATAEEGVRGFEDQILELLVAADEIGAEVKTAESALQQEQKAVASERTGIEDKRQRTEAELADLGLKHAAVEREMARDLVRLYHSVAQKRRGSAVVPARDGHCTACHTRLRPQFYNELRSGDRVFQCESCSRILFHVATPPPVAS